MAKLATLKEDFDEPESCWFRYMQSQKKKSRNRFEAFGKLWQKSINNSFRTPVDFLSRHFVIDVL